MAGLNLIQEYLSDADEEIEKPNDENNKIFKVKDEKSKLPLPQSIISWKGTIHHEEVIDDPLRHKGRIRSFKHERGNWATLIYINYIPNDNILLWMKQIVTHVLEASYIFENFHVSLTRTLILKFHWIDSFVKAVKTVVDSYQSFVVELGNIKIYCNEEKTRTFMGITVQSINDSLQKLTQALDKVMDEFQLPTFYEDASYHISFLWCLGDQRKMLQTLLPSLTSSLHDFLVDNPEQRYIQIDEVKCKIGNKLYNFKLT